MLRMSVRAAVIALLCGWGTALIIGIGFALLQYQELARSLPPDQVSVAFQDRLDLTLRHGTLLLYVQGGILCGVLWWMVARTNASGLLAGAIVAGVQIVMAQILESSLLFWIPMAAIIVAVGAFSARSRSAVYPSPDTSSEDPPHP